MLIWSQVENGWPLDGEEFYNEGGRLLTEARNAFPSNPVLPLYFEQAWTSHSPEHQVDEYKEWDWVEPQQVTRSY